MKIIKINAMWCSACISMHKIWKQIENDYPQIEITSYDYDMDEDIVKNYNVGDILPVAIFYENDIEIARLIGEKKLNDIIEIIDSKKEK